MSELVPNEAEIRRAISQALAEDYRIKGELSRLPGENLNFLVQGEKNEKYVVKIAADDQSESFVEMEFLALRHASSQLDGIQLPQIYENKYRNVETYLEFSGNIHNRLRVINFLSGTLLEDSDISDELRFNVGLALARFDRAMVGFDHPSAHRPHRWDLTRAIQHEGNTRYITDPQKHQLLSWAYEQYKNIDAGKMKQVNWQFIHGDPNPENILVAGNRVTGLLDFGDSCHNPRICELAICLPYLMTEQDDPMAVANPVIAGYQSISPLTEGELGLLWPLILGRLATTLSVATARRQVDAGHPNWFVSEKRAWRLLARLRELPKPDFRLGL